MAKGMLILAGEPGAGGPDKAPCSNEVAVPKEALLIDSALPKVGDEVDFQASGKVTRIDDDNYIVEVTQANDKPVQDADSDDGETADPGADRKAAMDSVMSGGDDDGQ